MEVDATKIEGLIEKRKGAKNALIAILQDIQAECNYLPRESLQAVSRELGLPLVDVVGVATFYRAFSLKPRGRHVVTVCTGTACHVRGGPRILTEFEKQLGIQAGETTPDNMFSLETVACLGCCAIGPVVVVDGEYYAHTTIRRVAAILKRARKKGARHESQ